MSTGNRCLLGLISWRFLGLLVALAVLGRIADGRDYLTVDFLVVTS
jgi:hypothetical protein